jgi:LmbE family N-acetylglucosaminyl deacetylase
MLEKPPTHTPDNLFQNVEMVTGEGILCLAPHPDDEVLGCGGLLMLAQGQGMRVQVTIVTAGDQGLAGSVLDNPRLEESQAAARIMGLPEPDCWHLPDRQLRHSPPLIERIVQALRAHQPRWLLLPALTEPHPDHQALALAGMAAAQQQGDVSVLFYEVGAPTQANTLVDITSVAERKWQALQAFGSQEALHGYRQHAQAMSAVRAFVCPPQVKAAEAFWQVSAQALSEHELTPALGGWPLQRNAMGLASTPGQLPLVTIIVRSMARPSLSDAIASVAMQTYPNIEVVVVNATGGAHPLPSYPRERLALRMVGQPLAQQELPHIPALLTEPQWQPLGRSAAANLGLRFMQGELGLFLDDDDLLQPTHLQDLVQALHTQWQAVAAYSGVRVEGPGGQWLRDYNLPWQRERLWGINHLPIHAVLFRRSAVLGASAQFDETLPVLEDWDFWCQLSHRGPFAHVPGLGATYRQGLGNSHLGDAEHANHWAPWHRRILEQHARRWGLEEQSRTLAWNALALDKEQTQHQQTQQQLQASQAQLDQTQQQHQLTQAELQVSLARQDQIHAQHQQTQQQLQASQAQLDQTQQQHQLTQAELQVSLARQDQIHAQYQLTQAELQASQAQLDQTQQQHQQTQNQLQKVKAQLLQTQVLRQDMQVQIYSLQANHSLAERSLQMLQQSRAVRAARVLRRVLRRV